MKRRLPSPSEQPDNDTGSPQPGGPVFLAVGRLRRPHGIHGEIFMEVLTDFPERIRPGTTLSAGDDHTPLVVSQMRATDKALLITFEGFEDEQTVGILRNKIVYVRAENLPELPEGEYYHHQLLGLRVLDESGAQLGFLSEILETGANDVYLVVSPEGKEVLLPVIEGVVQKVDLNRGEMTVRAPEWL